MSDVAIVKCSDYSKDKVESSIERIFKLLDLSRFVKPGQKVLLKPNLLMNFKPEKGVTTHPAIVKAVADKVIEMGGAPYIGDSPGGIGSMYGAVIKDSGMGSLGIPIVSFEEKGVRRFPNPGGKIDPLLISNKVLEFDLIINIPKMKTHELTEITCGIKNMFGCVPGLHKVQYHLAAQTKEAFARELVVMFSKIVPAITIVDAVVSMEGKGPSGGSLRQTDLVIASTDTVAVDAVCSMIMGYEPLSIDTTRIANEMGLGEADLEKIRFVGEKPSPISSFVHAPAPNALINKLPPIFGALLSPLIAMIKVRPQINRKKCVKCLMCVRSCPVQAIDGLSFKVDRKKCIMCFCCRELCKYGAVDMKESLLWKLVNKGMKK